MMDFTGLDRRPLIVAIAGPNGAGKTTFFHSQLAPTGLRFVNADVLANELAIEPYQAARVAGALRRALVERGESFVFETVFSDPVQDKIQFLEAAERHGYTVVVCFIGLANANQSVERIAIRVAQGGHDVPTEKLSSRFPRTLDNLRLAISRLAHVLIFDNSDPTAPFRHVASFDFGRLSHVQEPIPDWVRPMIPQ